MRKKRLMVVGPQPPPLGGGTASVQLLLDELRTYEAVQTIAIDTSPHLQNKKTGVFKRGAWRRAVFITRQYIGRVKHVDAVLTFTNHSFMFSLGGLLLWLARCSHVPFYVKPMGGDLGLFLETRNRMVRTYMLRLLRSASGILVQTRRLQTELRRMGCLNTHYVPGYRSAVRGAATALRNEGRLRILFLSQIIREKGPFLLLEALRILSSEEDMNVECDFYGPIPDEDRREFQTQLKATEGARYRGMARVGDGSSLMARYDVLVFPTQFIREGHPGVIIEAMQAGIPVISTQHMSIPELITDGENGLLVPSGNANALASAIKRLANDPGLRKRMGLANFRRGQEFRSDKVIAQMMEIIFPGINQPGKPDNRQSWGNSAVP